MASAPNPENVLSNPPTATVPSALNIAVNPRPISSQDISPNFLKASARSFNPWIAINNDALPINPAILVKYPMLPLMTPSSVRAPPIPVNPRPISSQDISPNFLKASARSFNPWIIIRIDAEAKILENPAILPSPIRTIPNSPRAPPIPVNPRPISSQYISPKPFKPSAIFLRD